MAKANKKVKKPINICKQFHGECKAWCCQGVFITLNVKNQDYLRYLELHDIHAELSKSNVLQGVIFHAAPCKWFDTKTLTCKFYDRRPDICKNWGCSLLETIK